MAAHPEALLPIPDRRIRHKRTHSLVGPVLSTFIAAGALAGLGYAVTHGGSQPQETNMPTATQHVIVEFPTPQPAASEKAINKVPLAPLTKDFGTMAIVPFGGEKTKQNPYGYSLSFQAMTVVDIQQIDTESMWVAISTDGKKLEKDDAKKSDTNFDGTKTEEYFYKGFTAWILVDNNLVVSQEGSNIGYQGLNMLKSNIAIGKTISFNTSPNQNGNEQYEQMNLKGLDLLNKSVGKDTSDRSKQIFTFKADFAFLSPKS